MLLVAIIIAGRTSLAAGQTAPPPNADSWVVPANAATEQNPVAVNDKVLKEGLKLYGSKCERCHGSTGKGDGPDADPDRPPADLADADRAAKNPDGILFYKIWNGRKNPNMPPMKMELSRPQVWTVIHYVKKFRE
jgi:mono/diheme cytochrome c family protein